MPQRQFTGPLLLKGGKASVLHRVPFGERSYDESWLQNLLFDHPSLIPATELEPAFSDLIPLAKEMPTPAGFVDLVYMLKGWAGRRRWNCIWAWIAGFWGGSCTDEPLGNSRYVITHCWTRCRLS